MALGMEGLPEALVITPQHWPEEIRGRKPGAWDFEAPELPSPSTLAELFPDLDLPDDQYKALKRYAFDPVLTAPLLVPSAGTVYFERQDAADLHSLFKVLGIKGDTHEYVAFATSAYEPAFERYLTQLKFVTFFALERTYRLTSQTIPPEQTITLAEAMVGFVECQHGHWLGPRPSLRSRLAGTAGGNGDEAREGLGFGLHVEKVFQLSIPGIYRMWSRAWLVTK